jgi:hypothetical protein
VSSNSAFTRVEDTNSQTWNSATPTGYATKNTAYEFINGSVDLGEILTAGQESSEGNDKLSTADKFFAELGRPSPTGTWGI